LRTGYTLVEVLVVLAILAMLAAVVLPRTTRIPVARGLPLVTALQKEQAKAAQTGRSVRVSFRGNRLLYANDEVEIYKLGEGEKLQIEGAGQEGYLGAVPAVVFHGDGTMTMARWRFARDDGVHLIRFSPFSNRIVVERE